MLTGLANVGLNMWNIFPHAYGAESHCRSQVAVARRAARCNFDWPAASNEPKRGTKATHFVRYEEIQLGKAAAQVMVLFAERGVKEGQEITWSYGDSYKSHRKEMGYRAGTRANPNAITPQQARTAFARYCKKIDVTKEELAWNFGCISASQNKEPEAVLVRELILSNNKRLYQHSRAALIKPSVSRVRSRALPCSNLLVATLAACPTARLLLSQLPDSSAEIRVAVREESGVCVREWRLM